VPSDPIRVLLHADVPALVAALGSEFYVEEGAMRRAIAKRASFNAIHKPTVLKVDFFVLGDAPFDHAQLEGRRLSPALEGSDRRVFVSGAEDLVLRKLDWYRQGGGVSDRQRFGSALDLNVHFHTLALDAVYTCAVGQGQPTRFLPLPPPEADEVARVLAGAARRIQRVIEARAGDEADALARDEPLLALLAAASLRTRVATGPHRGEPWRRLGDRVEPSDGNANEADPEASARVPQHGGMSLHADVSVPARDRRRLERLSRYVARPPLANERLEERPDGRLALRLKTRWRDGTTHILMERRELIDRLVPLIPPPRAHQVRYHGSWLRARASATGSCPASPSMKWTASCRDGVASAVHRRDATPTNAQSLPILEATDRSAVHDPRRRRALRLASPMVKRIGARSAPPGAPAESGGRPCFSGSSRPTRCAARAARRRCG
jgi:hypothetical protein